MVHTRRAVLEDANDIAEVQVSSWRTAYRGLLPQRYLQELDVKQHAEAWRYRLGSHEGLELCTFVAERGDLVIGFISLYPSRDEDADPTKIGEVTAVYTRPDHWGTGAGRQLMRLAHAWLAGRFESATLWVLDRNERARGFYEAEGWRADGTVKHDESRGFPVVEVRYRRNLR